MNERDRIRELVDERAISAALTQFCLSVDRYDVDGAAEVFTDDCVTDYGPARGGALAGREAFRARLSESQSRFAHTHHQLGQLQVEVTGDTATTIAYCTASHVGWDGHRHDGRLQYHDQWVRTRDGWQICHRQAFATVLDGVSAEGMPRVPRIRPQPSEHRTGLGNVAGPGVT
jgi:ketosteroid isomerase-like protein